MVKPYTQLDHTADLKIRVTGDDPAGLFKNAGMALFDLIIGQTPLSPEKTVTIEVSGVDWADLMVNYLRELLFLWTGREKLVKMIDILNISETAVEVGVTLARYVPDRHGIIHEIKAVTYHQIQVNRTSEGWQAIVVFDI
jgi:SHS2 domain-containing protein